MGRLGLDGPPCDIVLLGSYRFLGVDSSFWTGSWTELFNVVPRGLPEKQVDSDDLPEPDWQQEQLFAEPEEQQGEHYSEAKSLRSQKAAGW
jgi:hypothetical protein